MSSSGGMRPLAAKLRGGTTAFGRNRSVRLWIGWLLSAPSQPMIAETGFSHCIAGPNRQA